jgi:hypothetical protein
VVFVVIASPKVVATATVKTVPLLLLLLLLQVILVQHLAVASRQLQQ